MLVERKVLEYYLKKAKEQKEQIKSLYNEVLELTDTFSKIEDSGKQKIGDIREVDADIIDAIDAYRSFIMSSVLSRTGEWASIYLDEKRIIEEKGEGIKNDLEAVKSVLPSQTSKVFNYIQSSNYYSEISRSMETFIKVGTGAFAIRETGSTSKPFMFEYVGLNNLFFVEDSLSRPTIIFKLHPEVNGTYIKDIFGSDAKLPQGISEEELEQVTDVYEIIIPIYDEETTLTTYNYMIMTSDLNFLIKEIALQYPPIIIFRYDTIEGNAWGKSTVMSMKGKLKELNEYKDLYVTQAKKIADPPMAFAGNEELFYQLDLNEASINYIGDPQKEGIQGSLTSLTPNVNLMPLDKVIEEIKMSFRKALLVDDLLGASMDTGKGITAQYVSWKAELFRKRFANTYELINSELLEPTFLAPLNIMLKYKMLDITEEILPFTNIQYQNSLSKANDMGDVNNLINYTQVINGLNQANGAGVALDLAKATEWVGTKMGINKELVPTEEELRQIQEARKQMLLEQQAMQQQTQEQTEQ